jgi:Protein of unknown function (DUF4065)
MTFEPITGRRVTYKVALDGGQERLRELILYIAKKCHNAPRFGAVKLNKILWKADFDAFAARGVPVTGRAYQRLEKGPAPIEMAPLYGEMLRNGLVRVEHVDFGDGIVERRTVPLVEPRMQYFTEDDIRFVDESITYYWDKTGTQASDDSHGVAWQTRADGDPMPYELSYLAYDQRLKPHQRKRIRDLVVSTGFAK